MADRGWAERQLEKRGPGERMVHTVPCKDVENYKGWLVATDQRIWFFQQGPAGASEEFEYDCEISRRTVPFSFGKKVMLLIGKEPFTLPTEDAEEFESVVRSVRAGRTAG